MRNILVHHVVHKDKERFAGKLKSIWITYRHAIARKRARELVDEYSSKYHKAIEILEERLEDVLTFLSFP